jgi:hypothetical protein
MIMEGLMHTTLWLQVLATLSIDNLVLFRKNEGEKGQKTKDKSNLNICYYTPKS